MKETFCVTGTFYLPRMNWPKDSLAAVDDKSCSKFIIYASVGGLSKADTKSEFNWELKNG